MLRRNVTGGVEFLFQNDLANVIIEFARVSQDGLTTCITCTIKIEFDVKGPLLKTLNSTLLLSW